MRDSYGISKAFNESFGLWEPKPVIRLWEIISIIMTEAIGDIYMLETSNSRESYVGLWQKRLHVLWILINI